MNDKNKLIVAAAIAGILGMGAPVFAADDAGKVECAGVNGCKGKSDCKTASNECAGKNGCKGKGMMKMSKADCDKAQAAAKAKKKS